MDAVSFGLAVLACIGTVDNLIRQISSKVTAYINAAQEIPPLLRNVQHQCLKLRKDLEILDSLKIDASVDSIELIELQKDGLRCLEAKAAKLSYALSQSDNKSARERLRYALKHKSAVSRFHDDIQQWYAKYTASFYLLARVIAVYGNSTTDCGQITYTITRLREVRVEISSKYLDQPQLAPLETRGEDSPIRFSTAMVSQNYAGRPILVDLVEPSHFCPNKGSTRKDMQDLALILSKFDPVSTGLLTCDRVGESAVGTHLLFELFFSFPPGLGHPSALRELLHDQSSKALSINTRLAWATSLTKSVLSMHAAAFVHRNIRPEAILVFDSPKVDQSLFLVGFQYFRLAAGETSGKGDEDWTKAIYRHPQRQGLHPESNYIMQHDIYSLGVCLIELGLWESFIRYNLGDDAVPSEEPYPSCRFKAHPKVSPDIPLRMHARETKLRLEELARNDLPRCMGQKYTNVVLSCLTCLEDSKFGGELEDRSGLTIGARFIKLVYQELQSIHV